MVETCCDEREKKVRWKLARSALQLLQVYVPAPAASLQTLIIQSDSDFPRDCRALAHLEPWDT